MNSLCEYMCNKNQDLTLSNFSEFLLTQLYTCICPYAAETRSTLLNNINKQGVSFNNSNNF